MPITQFPDPTDRYIICTSSTRPPAPYDGLMIYETDTNLLYVYDAASPAWRVVGLLPLQQTTVVQGSVGGNNDTTSATYITWSPALTVTIPSWATTAYVQASIVGMYNISNTCGIGFRCSLDGVAGRQMSASGVDFASPARSTVSWADVFTGFSTGASKSIIVEAFRSSGTGAMRIDTSTDHTYFVTFSS